MRARTTTTLALFASLTAACTAADSPAVELINGANKNDAVTVSLTLAASDSTDFFLDCENEAGCDIMLVASGVDDAMTPLDITLLRPDGFSRTESPVSQEGGVYAAFFAQPRGTHIATITNRSDQDLLLAVSASWYETTEVASAPIGDSCDDASTCPEGFDCITGFCTPSCARFGQARCDAVDAASICAAVDEEGNAYCFKTCDPTVENSCGADHLACLDVSDSIPVEGTIGVCTAAVGNDAP